MAIHARITTALLSATGQRSPLLRQGSGRQPGPVTQAIRACREADPADLAIAAIQEGLDRFFAETGIPVTAGELRRRIEDRIEADLELLEALDGDPDAEPSLGSIDAASHSNYMNQEAWNLGGGQDREAGDDNGIADWGGEHEQNRRFLALGENLNEYARRFA